jgi:hypothetical protein
VEAFQEGLELLFYCGSHFCVRNQLNILIFVFFSHALLASAREEFLGLNLSEVVKAVVKVEFKVVFDGTVVQYPFQALEIFVVLFFHVQVSYWQVQDMLIEGRCEIGIKKITVIKSLPCYPTDKLEILQV